MLSDDLVFIVGTGRRRGKAEFVAAFTSPGFALDPFVVVDPVFVDLGADAAIIGGEVTLAGMEAGQPFSEHIRFADTFARRDGRWMVVHVQVTVIR